VQRLASKKMTMTFTRRNLFGGAIVCELPENWKDVSEIRQVPDHQEVYHGLSEGDDEPCFIMEILEYQDAISDHDVASFFWNDLKESNDCVSDIVLYHQIPNNESFSHPMFTCLGIQFMNGKNRNIVDKNILSEDVEMKVLINLCVVRLPHVTSDLLITLSRKTILPLNEEFQEEFLLILSSLNILDWTIFGV
jgi:Ran-interacting Mog1 protein